MHKKQDGVTNSNWDRRMQYMQLQQIFNQMKLDKRDNLGIIFHIALWNVYCDPWLEPSRRDGFNEESQHTFSLRNKIKYIWIILNIPSYLELGSMARILMARLSCLKRTHSSVVWSRIWDFCGQISAFIFSCCYFYFLFYWLAVTKIENENNMKTLTAESLYRYIGVEFINIVCSRGIVY